MTKKSKDPAEAIGEAIFSVIKPIYKEGEKTRRSHTSSRRKAYYAPEYKTSQKRSSLEFYPDRFGTPVVDSAPATSTRQPAR